MSELQPLVGRGWTCEQEEYTGRGTSCRNECGETLHTGDMVWMLRAKKGQRKHAFCSVVCQRQYTTAARAHFKKKWEDRTS